MTALSSPTLCTSFFCSTCKVGGRYPGPVPVCWNCREPATETGRRVLIQREFDRLVEECIDATP